MCGIVGYVGRQKASAILIEGLKRLEYRGYDSAGLAVLQNDRIDFAKKAGRVGVLVKEAKRHRFTGTTGISHTRWATHGGVTDANAHPHLSSDGQIALVHNGVIENYVTIKKFLLEKGYTFASETDTEVLCNLIAYHFAKEPVSDGQSRFMESVRKSLRHVEGTYGIATLCVASPGEIVAARKGSPLILGVGDQEFILASDVSALVSRTQNVVYLKDGECVHVTAKEFFHLDAGRGGCLAGRGPGDVEHRPGGARRSPALHGEGNLRAAGRAGKLDARALLRGWQHGQVWRPQPRPGGIPADRPLCLPGLWHRLAFVPCGGASDRAIRPDARGGGLCLGIPLPQRPGLRQPALFRLQPIGRDHRHARRAPGGQAQGLPGPRHQQHGGFDHRAGGRWRHLPARRARNRGGVHQGVHLATADRGDAGAAYRAHARHEFCRWGRVCERAERRARPRAAGARPGPARSRKSPCAMPTTPTFFFWAGFPSFPSRWRGPSN